jgi:hypothetical protein
VVDHVLKRGFTAMSRPGFDIEDAGKDFDPGFDDFVGIVDDDDLDAAEEAAEDADYQSVLDMFGDEIRHETTNPDNIDPLTFVPETVGDFLSLRRRITAICRDIPADLKKGFLLNLSSSLTRSLTASSLRQLASALHRRPA